MAERPLLVLPPPDVHDTRLKAGGGGGPSLRLPGRARQRDRLEHRLAALQEQFARRAVELRTSATGVEPEEVIVLEIAGEVADFARAVLRIEGLEWLAEVAGEDVDPDDDFYEVDKRDQKKQRPLGGRFFMVFSNQTALAQILGLWKSWQEEQELPRGFARWRHVFEQLRDVRRWSAADRIAETGLLADWRERLGLGGPVRCEIELWHRQSEARRQAARERVEALLAGVGGRVVMRCYVPEIAYDALVGEVSRSAVESLIAHRNAAEDIELLRCEDIQHVWPVGQMIVGGHVSDEGEEVALEQAADLGPPVSALFDGLPLQNHRALQDRLVVDDPDGFEEAYSARQRVHGTSMASIMVHGDLAASAPPLPRRVYVRPILKPHPWVPNAGEIVPEDQLIVDLVHRAIRRMKVGDGAQPAAAPHVCVVNLSIGDSSRPFHTALSPLARLLDWLSWRHQILFLVSSGNHLGPIRVPVSRDAFLSLSPKDQRSIILGAVAEGLRMRRLLCPSEAVNALTVGAMHSDSSEADAPPGHLDPFGATTLPSPVSCLGLGYRRSVKPDLLAVGGRCPLEIVADGDEASLLLPYDGPLPPGVLAAAPSARPGATAEAVYRRGTSVACAATSHWATRLYDVIEDLRVEHALEIDQIPRALWLKVLLIHAADWQRGYGLLEQCLKDESNSRRFREFGTRFIGYGTLEPERAVECAEHRATALGAGIIQVDERRTHRFPLPPTLSGKLEWKRLSITLAWFTPVNPLHQGWRRADLWFQAAAAALKVGREGADHHAVRRGTVQHEIYEGSQAAVFVDGDAVAIEISCKAGAGSLEEAVPYALAVTLEVGEGVAVPIYEEVRARIRPRVVVQPRST